MDTLPHETLLTLACYLDGDSYLAFSCASSVLHKTLNKETFLRDLTQANRLPFLVCDAVYYSYCYAQRFLTRHSLHNKENFYQVLKRTLQQGKMTALGFKHLQRHVVELMSHYLQVIDASAATELKRIYKRLRAAGAEVNKEIAAFFCSYTGEVLVEKKDAKREYLQRAKKEGVQNAFSSLFQATRYNQHEVALFVIKNYRKELDRENFSLSDFFCLRFGRAYG